MSENLLDEHMGNLNDIKHLVIRRILQTIRASGISEGFTELEAEKRVPIIKIKH